MFRVQRFINGFTSIRKDYQRKTILVVQMESEAYKTLRLQQQVAELERVIGQKQMEIDFLNKLLEIGSDEMGFDLKKNSAPGY